VWALGITAYRIAIKIACLQMTAHNTAHYTVVPNVKQTVNMWIRFYYMLQQSFSHLPGPPCSPLLVLIFTRFTVFFYILNRFFLQWRIFSPEDLLQKQYYSKRLLNLFLFIIDTSAETWEFIQCMLPIGKDKACKRKISRSTEPQSCLPLFKIIKTSNKLGKELLTME